MITLNNLTRYYLEETTEEFNKTLDAKLRSESLLRIIEAAEGTTRDALAANKYLLDGNWRIDKPTKGRPTKEAITKEAVRLATSEKELIEDYNRIKDINNND